MLFQLFNNKPVADRIQPFFFNIKNCTGFSLHNQFSFILDINNTSVVKC